MAEPGAPGDCPRDTQFYVCQLSGFRGCCSYDPCSSTKGCSDLESPRQSAAGSSLSLSSTSYQISSTAIEVGVPSATINPEPAPKDVGVSSPKHLGIIIGTATGGGTLLIILVALVIFWQKKKKHRGTDDNHAGQCCCASPFHSYHAD